ncbi:MAG: hypothetical protein WC269_02015 [Candidatus Gracilibacteria bacterium]
MYLVLGLSILLYAKQWQKLYAKWSDNHFELFTLMFFLMVGGLVVVYLHNVWTVNPWLLVTLSGWAMFLKGVFYFLLPGGFVKSVLKLAQNTTLLYLGGLVALVLGAALGYYAYLV